MTTMCVRVVSAVSVIAAVAFANVPADTGTLATAQIPDSTSYARYVSPSHCMLAFERLTITHWRDVDTVGIDNLTRILPEVAEAARQCSAKFGVETVPLDELPALGRINLAAGLEAKARQAFDRLMTSASDPRDRAEAILGVLQQYTQAHVLPKNDVLRYALALDSLGPSAAVTRLRAYLILAGRAKRDHDLPWLDSLVTRGHVAQSQLTVPDRRQRAGDAFSIFVLDAYRSALLASPDSAIQVLQRAQAMFGSLDRSIASRIEALQATKKAFGTAAMPLTGEFWFNTDVSAPVRPSPGKLSLLVYVSQICYVECTAGYSTLRRIVDRYSDLGLEVTLFANATGFFRQKPPQSAEEEAISVKELFLDQLKLPGALAFTSPGFDTLVDGRRMPRPGQNLTSYPLLGVSGDAPIGVLVDRSGTIRIIESIGPNTERTWDAMIRNAR